MVQISVHRLFWVWNNLQQRTDIGRFKTVNFTSNYAFETFDIKFLACEWFSTLGKFNQRIGSVTKWKEMNICLRSDKCESLMPILNSKLTLFVIAWSMVDELVWRALLCLFILVAIGSTCPTLEPWLFFVQSCWNFSWVIFMPNLLQNRIVREEIR